MIRYEPDPSKIVQPKGCEIFNPIWVQTYAARWLDSRGFGHEVVNEPVGGGRKNGIKCYSFTCEKYEPIDPKKKKNMDIQREKDYDGYLELLPTVLINIFTTEIIPETEGCVLCKFYCKNNIGVSGVY